MKIFIAGHKGMVGSAIHRNLLEVDGIELHTASRAELDFTNQKHTLEFFSHHKFDQVYLAAAKVGGILANNKYPADFIYENLTIQANVINSANMTNIDKILFLGSSCIYPKNATQPIVEEELLTGVLEETNEPYAIAKIAGIKMCESFNRQYNRDYRSVMPPNLYGPRDNFHPENSHVIAALIQRFHKAKINHSEVVTAWGTGRPLREFMHVDDLAKACIHIMNIDRKIFTKHVSKTVSHINIGTGEEISIRELTELVAKVVGFNGRISWDSSKPDGTPRKIMDSSKLVNLGWNASITLADGLENAYEWFLNNKIEQKKFAVGKKH